MSRFLKFIVNLIVICTILCVIALVVPPFFGVTTEIQKDSSSKSNLPYASVTYAIPVSAEKILSGDKILVTEQDTTYCYSVASLDLTSHRGTVMDTSLDPAIRQAEPIFVAFEDYLPRIVVTVPLIGYLMIATQRIEGMIILGLVALFLIILYVIAELWKPGTTEEEEIPDTEPGYVKSEKELKKEEKVRRRQMEAEELRLRQQEKLRKKSRDGKIRTGGFVDEVDESDLVEYPSNRSKPESYVSATSEAQAELKRGVQETTGNQYRGYDRSDRRGYDEEDYDRGQRQYRDSYRDSGRDPEEAQYRSSRRDDRSQDERGYRDRYDRDYRSRGRESYPEEDDRGYDEYSAGSKRERRGGYKTGMERQASDDYYRSEDGRRYKEYQEADDAAYDNRRRRSQEMRGMEERQPSASDTDHPQDRNDFEEGKQREPEKSPKNGSSRNTGSARRQIRMMDEEISEKPAEEDVFREQQGERRMAIPRYSAQELSRRAQDAGDDPEVMKDDITKVTFLDYSDIIANARSSMNDEEDDI